MCHRRERGRLFLKRTAGPRADGGPVGGQLADAGAAPRAREGAACRGHGDRHQGCPRCALVLAAEWRLTFVPMATHPRAVRLQETSFELLQREARRRGIDPDALADELVRTKREAVATGDLDAALASCVPACPTFTASRWRAKPAAISSSAALERLRRCVRARWAGRDLAARGRPQGGPSGRFTSLYRRCRRVSREGRDPEWGPAVAAGKTRQWA